MTGTRATPDPGDTGTGEPSSLVVKSDGAVAWIAWSGIENARNEPESLKVNVFDKSGSRVLVAGPEIDPSSLALAGSALYWTQGGTPMSAPLR